MKTKTTYKTTVLASYTAFIVQASVITLIPLLFTALRETLGISYTALATLLSVNFSVQLASDLLFSKAADKYGYKPFVIFADLCVAFGFLTFALSPYIFNEPYIGFLIGTVIFSCGGGLMEIMISPLIDSLPSKSKSGSMALLHSMYAWGQMGVIVFSTLFIFFFGNDKWPLLMILWIALPLIDAFMFAVAPFPEIAPHEKRKGIRKIITKPVFIICLFIIFFGAGIENTMVQWSSAFMEKALELPKLIGDTGGVLLFALFLGIGRIVNGVLGDKINLSKMMLYGCIFSFFCYVTVAISNIPILSLAACALTGLCASMLWPGALVIASSSFPQAGAWLFAYMAVAGDFGAAFCPWFAGVMSDNAGKISFLANFGNSLGLSAEQLGLRAGMLLSSIYSVFGIVFMLLFIKYSKKLKQ